MKKLIDCALLEAELHWRENVKKFPRFSRRSKKGMWFKKHCEGDTCSLCILGKRTKSSSDKLRESPCDKISCPLKDYGIGCCAEWQAAAGSIKIKKHHIQAVHRRIVNECHKRGLTLLKNKGG